MTRFIEAASNLLSKRKMFLPNEAMDKTIEAMEIFDIDYTLILRFNLNYIYLLHQNYIALHTIVLYMYAKCICTEE